MGLQADEPAETSGVVVGLPSLQIGSQPSR